MKQNNDHIDEPLVKALLWCNIINEKNLKRTRSCIKQSKDTKCKHIYVRNEKKK